MKLCAYCFIENSPSLPEFLTGIAGGEVRLLKVEEFSILVSDFSAETVSINRQNVLAHASVIQRILTRTTPLPFRFGTLVTEEQLRNYVAAKHQALKTKFRSIRGCLEMNTKVIWQGDGVLMERLPSEKGMPGTAFLAQKRREIFGSETRVAEAKSVASWLDQLVGDISRERRVEESRTNKMLLTAAHLVAREAVDEYRARLKAARAEKPELHFLVSGPWAPYSFANIELEFKSRFGVS